MSEASNRNRALAPVEHSPWRVPRHAGWIALIGALGFEYATCHEHQRDCATVAHTGADTAIIDVCGREYHRTQDPATGVRLAEGHRLAGNLGEARDLANKLQDTPAAGDALRVLGQVAKLEHHYDEAIALFTRARDLHRAEEDHDALARDDQAIAGVYSARHDQPAAIRMLDECIAVADDPSLTAYCHLSAAKAMRRSGAFDSARDQFDLAQPQLLVLERERDLAWMYFERGSLEQDARRIPRAPRRLQLERLSFESAIVHAHRAELPSVESAAELGLAWTLTDDHKLDDADHHLAIADELDDQETTYQRRYLHAALAFRRGRLDQAAAICDQIYDHVEPEQQINVSALQTRIALARQDYARAEQWAQRGIDQTRALRLTQPEVELRQWALWSRRVPYELMFVTRARAGRLDDAMATLDQWQGQAALDALSRPEPDQPPDLRGVAIRIERLRSWLPAIDSPPAAVTHIADAARTHDLLALFVADDHLWRVTSGRGRLAITDLGAMAGFEDDLRDLHDRPTDPVVAARLGARLIPDVRASDDSLRVVLDAALDGLPVAALRVGGQPVIAARPVIYATSVSRLACRPRMPAPHPVVILGDAERNLPEADAEARATGQRLHAAPALGADATAEALWAAGPGSLLHVALHGDIDGSGGFLALADGGLHALDILRRGRAPELVVLSACVSALSTGRELADSLASAFLAAGATQVVATLRTVPDDTARDVMAKLYAAGGADDPARALARVQRQLAADGDPSWPSFAVFGQDLCVTRPERAMLPARARPR